MSDPRDPLDLEFAAYAAEQMPAARGDELQKAQRLYFAGALACLTLQRQGVKAADIQRELVEYGRLLGRQRVPA